MSYIHPNEKKKMETFEQQSDELVWSRARHSPP